MGAKAKAILIIVIVELLFCTVIVDRAQQGLATDGMLFGSAFGVGASLAFIFFFILNMRKHWGLVGVAVVWWLAVAASIRYIPVAVKGHPPVPFHFLTVVLGPLLASAYTAFAFYIQFAPQHWWADRQSHLSAQIAYKLGFGGTGSGQLVSKKGFSNKSLTIADFIELFPDGEDDEAPRRSVKDRLAHLPALIKTNISRVATKVFAGRKED